MNNLAEKQLDIIAREIFSYAMSDSKKQLIGLYDGDFGILLFMYYYSKYSNNKDYISITDYFSTKIIDNFEQRVSNHTYATGLSGILYTCNFLKRNNFVDIELDPVISSLEKYIIDGIRFDIQNNKYDFLHGALGGGFYFIRENINHEVLNDLLEFLYRSAEIDKTNDIIKWKSTLGISNTIGYNVCLSHGISSIIIFIAKFINHYKNNTKAHYILNGAVNYILSQEINHKEYGSFFPNQSKANISKSRLAWCYGDLGVAYSLWKAGLIIGNDKWKTKGLDILVQTTNRTVLQDESVGEASICHGTSGIAMFNNSIYKKTKLDCFKQSRDFWIDQTIEFLVNKIGKNRDYSLLTGISGIGLVLLSYISDDDQDWDEIFLL